MERSEGSQTVIISHKKCVGMYFYMGFYSNGTYVQSSVLTGISHISHGFSRLADGDMRHFSPVTAFAKKCDVATPVFFPRQVHGNTIADNPREGTQVDADGVFLRRGESQLNSIGVLTADCTPVLFSDIHGSCIGAVHAGWKGTYSNIVGAMLSKFEETGIPSADIRVSVGPHIGGCCYSVPNERIEILRDAYPCVQEYAYRETGIWHLDIGKIIVSQLLSKGIRRQQIDTGIFCTSCQSDQFFSYRKNTKEEFGEMAAIIGFT